MAEHGGHGGHGGGHEAASHSSHSGGAASFIEGLLGMGAEFVGSALTSNAVKAVEEGRHFAPDGIKSSGRGGKGGGGGKGH